MQIQISPPQDVLRERTGSQFMKRKIQELKKSAATVNGFECRSLSCLPFSPSKSCLVGFTDGRTRSRIGEQSPRFRRPVSGL